MGAFIRRELRLMARQRALGAALFVHAAAMTVLVLAGLSRGAPLFQFAVLGLVLPWTAARGVSARPAPMVTARAAAAAIGMAIVVAAGFPVMLLAARLEGTGLAGALRAELLAQLLSLAVVALVLVWRRLSSDRLLGWAGATASTLALVLARVLAEVGG